MPRRTKEDLEREFERVASIFQVITDFQRQEMPEMAEYLDLIPSTEEMRDTVALGKATLSQIISGTQIAIDDFQRGLSDFNEETHYLRALAERGPDANRFLAFYRERTGRKFHADVIDTEQALRSIMKRGTIANDVEYYAVGEIVNDLSQRSLSEAELVRLGGMVAEFERLQGA
ncbi:MAG: hypothetical protein ABJL99_07290 [Aliishimia sp.]